MKKCVHGRELCEDCAADAFEERFEGLKSIIVELDSYLSLARHRYQGILWPDDFVKDVDAVIHKARKVVKP
jgi:hypothetical protein